MSKQINIVSSAFSTDEFDTAAPEFVVIQVDTDRLKQVVKLCNDFNLVTVEIDDIGMLCPEGDYGRMIDQVLCITKNWIWLSADVKHSDYKIQSVLCDVDAIFNAIDTGITEIGVVDGDTLVFNDIQKSQYQPLIDADTAIMNQ